MFCIKCGHQINDGTKFCPKCGSSQSVASETSEKIEETTVDGFNFHNWIAENGLESSESILKRQDLDTLDVLMNITESDLDKIGIDSIGTKRKILNGIQKLKTSFSTYTATKEITGKEGIPHKSPKSRLTAALLAFFFGDLGAHRFYVGKFFTGFIQLILGLSFLISLILFLFDALVDELEIVVLLMVLLGIVWGSWTLIDFIMILGGSFKDGKGLEITDWNL